MELKEALLVVQLLTTLNDDVEKLEVAYKEKNLEDLERLKKEILVLQAKIDAAL